MNKQLIALVLAACVSTALPPPAGAQVKPDSAHNRNDCRLVRQILVHGQPANKRTWALAKLPNCGPFAVEVVQHYMNRHRSDENFGTALNEVISASLGLVDRNLAFAALAVAMDQTAGTAARIQALRLLYAQVVPTTTVSYERFTRPEIVSVTRRDDGSLYNRIEPLEPDMVTDRFVAVITPFETGDAEHYTRALERLASGAQRADLRLAAQRAAAAFRSYQRCPLGTRAQDCIKRFRGETNPD